MVSSALIIVVAVLLLPLSIGTFRTVDFIENPPVEDAMIIKVEGRQFSWSFTYPEGFSVRNQLVVPIGKVIVLEVTSTDVFHTYTIQDFRIKADAIPGRVNRVWFKATQPGVYNSQCAELCGVGHAFMRAKVIVMEPREFESWRAKKIGGGS